MSAMDYDDDYMNDDDDGDDYTQDTQESWMDQDEDEDEDGEEDFGAGDGFEPVVADRDIKKGYQVDFKVHSIDDIVAFQTQEVAHVAGILGCRPEHAATLLRAFKWNKERLIERYMENPEDVANQAGVVMDADKQAVFSKSADGFECQICYTDDDDLDTVALHCGHRFHTDCYAHYLQQKICEEGESRRIQCCQSKCTAIVDEATIEKVVPPDVLSRYQTLLIRTYVDDSVHLKWCPGPDCEYAIECHVPQKQLQEIVPTVRCKCGFTSCFGCGLDDHQPCICLLVKFWLKKCADDSETANWISANTKECLKCQTTIEKNGGCNHMTCKKCKYEFCWVCAGPWSDHGTAWYSCNRWEEKASVEARDSQARSRKALERYLHYYNRYANHIQSAKLSSVLLEKTAAKMEALQSTSTLSWIEVQFLRKACDVLLEARMTMKWTYAFAYFLKHDNMRDLFEDNQRDLEMAVENLNELLERPIPGVEGTGTLSTQNSSMSLGGGAGGGIPTTASDPRGAPLSPLSKDISTASIPGTATPPSAAAAGAVSVEEGIRVLRQQVLDKMGYLKTRREVLLTDTAQGLREHRWMLNVDLKTGVVNE
ncbi:hypothetical protein HDU88_004334 [Geranomyces variabilis]|nr:hypothetical protein HDU88_004334 [Geranomyces variabilis]